MDLDLKYVDWNLEKNRKLIEERGISFEDVMETLFKKGELEITDNPNQKRYPNQKLLIVKIESYVYLVPYVVDEKKIFLKTIIPSRKATKKYLKGGDSNETL